MRQERHKMQTTALILLSAMLGYTPAALAAANADAGRQLVERSCSSCHATNAARTATDGAPSLSFIAKDNKARPAWIRGWLMEPHPPMPSISLSRQQIDDVIAYLGTLPTD
jgi:mono/diheme cytochrome c family protein